MARKAAGTEKGDTPRGVKTRAGKNPPWTKDDQATAAYYQWLHRGAPLWDDQKDWYAVEPRIKG